MYVGRFTFDLCIHKHWLLLTCVYHLLCMYVASGMLCKSESPQLHFSKPTMDKGEKHWPRWKCLTADVRDGNETLTHVKDHHVKTTKKDLPYYAVEGLYTSCIFHILLLFLI